MADAPPPVEARFFYASLLAIDDPLSPVPPPTSSATVPSRLAPRPLSVYDNHRLEEAWHDLRRDAFVRAKSKEKSKAEHQRPPPVQRPKSPDARTTRLGVSLPHSSDRSSGSRDSRTRAQTIDSLLNAESELPTTTGTPFIRAPSRRDASSVRGDRGISASRPQPQALDSYKWDDGHEAANALGQKAAVLNEAGPTAKIAVGVSRLHQVVMPQLSMEPIYWSPVNDISRVVRATWFYRDSMMPVEVPVANMLELGYTELRVWTQTWQDELDSAVRVGAAGEERILRKLWPDEPIVPREIKSALGKGEVTSMLQPMQELDLDPPETRRQKLHDDACRYLNSVTGPDRQDNRASGLFAEHQGGSRSYATAGIIYASATEAHILKPSLQPSAYYGRRPLASYIRRGRQLGVPVVRGFDRSLWDKLYPPKKSSKSAKAHAGVSTSADGSSVNARRSKDPELEASLAPKVTDLILVIHGIGQKLSERMESFHFTHAMNAFRREVNVELGSDAVRTKLRDDAGGVMLLPVNWRHTLSFEEGGYQADDQDPGENLYGLKDITPDTLTSVRNIVSDVMLDIPYYLSHHKPKMIAAVIKEANRIYKLWCVNNPGFHQTGRVHIVAHSLGSVMALDILSNQPTKIPPHLHDPTKVDLQKHQLDHFLFPTSNLFFAGSPSGFFLLLKRAPLLPRLDHPKTVSEDANTSSICGSRGDYGCIPVDNIYNIINPYDPVSYRLNATVDAAYAATLKSAQLPSASQGWFSSSSESDGRGWFGTSTSDSRPPPVARQSSGTSPSALLPRLPSNVELATHDFSREDIAEKRMLALNDNGQIDYLLRYGGGPLEIQYLTMLGAHSSYWLLKDFVRAIVIECGRVPGREGTIKGMRAAKKRAV